MATANLSVTTTETFDLAVWVYDLNAPGTPSQQVVLNANGALLNQGAALTVPLIEDAAGNVSYQWAAEQIKENIRTTIRTKSEAPLSQGVHRLH